jgi:hypothetical protein
MEHRNDIGHTCTRMFPYSYTDTRAHTHTYTHPQWWKPYFPKGSKQWGPYTSGRTPVIDKWAGRPQGGLVDCIKNGRIKCVGSLVGACQDRVHVYGAHGNAEWRRCDVIVFATGFDHTYADWLPQVSTVVCVCVCMCTVLCVCVYVCVCEYCTVLCVCVCVYVRVKYEACVFMFTYVKNVSPVCLCLCM